MVQSIDIGTIESNLIGTRILPLEGQTPLPIEVGGVEIEHTFKGVGCILKIGLAETFTSKSVFYPIAWAKFGVTIKPAPPPQLNGFYESQSNGIMITLNGERITWVGHGIGLPHDYANSDHLGAAFFRTSSSSLAGQFNGLVAIVQTSIKTNMATGVTKAIRKFWQISPSP